MIDDKETAQFDLRVTYTKVNRPSTGKGTAKNRVTGSIFRECLTTITRA